MLRRDLLQTLVAWAAAAVGLRNDDPAASESETAVVDRIEDGTAVVVFEASGRQRAVPPPVLPPAAREEGTVLRVPNGDDLALADVDRAATRERRQAARDRFDDLGERPDRGP